jgi:uncharacterized membrane protein YkvI
MFKNIKPGLTIAAVYIGAVIGAGFATGQELMRYFVRFGAWGFAAIVLCGGIFALVGYKVLYFMHLWHLKDYGDFLRCTMGKSLGKVTELTGLCFLMVLYGSMLAAADSLLNAWLNISCGSLLTAVLCTLLVLGGASGLGVFNLMLCPLLVGGSITVGLWLFAGNVAVPTLALGFKINDNLLGSAVVYISYNIISCVSLICTLAPRVKRRRDALLGGVIGGVGIMLTGLALALPLYKYFNAVVGDELPIFALVADRSRLASMCYAVLLMLAVLTTAAGNCYSIAACFKTENKLVRLLFTCLVSLAALALSRIGFKEIVGKMYYAFGCLGLIQLCVIVNLKLDDK